MSKATKPTPQESEAKQLFDQHHVSRYVRVLDIHPGGVAELALRPNHRISFTHAVTDEGQWITRIFVAPLGKSKKPAGAGS